VSGDSYGRNPQIGNPVSPTLAELQQRLAALTAPGVADNTLRAYDSDWKQFETWCTTVHLCPLPAAPETVALYLASMLDRLKVSTMQRRLWAVGRRHREAALDNPVTSPRIQELLRLARKRRPPRRQVRPLTVDRLHTIIQALGDSLTDSRDGALLMTLWTAAMRRSEAVGLHVHDLAWDPPGAVLWLAHSKTDQEGQGRFIPIPAGPDPAFCPVTALRVWLRRARISHGPVFRAVDRWGAISSSALSDRAVALIVKARCAAVGLDPAEFSGHSCRSGFCTTTKQLGIDARAAMAVTGHTSEAMFNLYVRPEGGGPDPAGTALAHALVNRDNANQVSKKPTGHSPPASSPCQEPHP